MSLKDTVDDELNLKEQLEKIAKESIGKATRKTGIEDLNVDEIAKNFQKTLLDMLKPFSDKIEEYQAVIKEMGGITALLTMAWNVEEETVDVITFESLIAWSKRHFNQNKHSAVCFLVPKKTDHDSQRTDRIKEYNLFFLNKNNKPILDGSEAHKIFYAKTVDADLKAQLADKNMLLLK